MVTAAARAGVGRRLLVSTMAMQFAFGLVYAWGVVAPDVERADRWPPLLVAAVLSGNPVGWSIGITVGGRLADRYSPRSLCVAAVGMMAAGFAAAFAAPAPLTFIVCYAVLALGTGGGMAMAGSLAAIRQVMPAWLGTASGAMAACYALAALVEVPLVSRLDVTIGWLNALRAVGGGLVLLCVLALLVMPSLPRAAPGVSRPRSTSVRAAVARAPVLTALLLALSVPPVGAGAFSHLGTYAAHLHMSPVIATGSLVAVAVGNFLGRMSGGAASDWAGSDLVMLLALGLVFAAAVALWSGAGPTAMLLGGLAAGGAFGIAYGALPRLAAAASQGEAANFTYGVVSIGFAAGTFIGPLLVTGAGPDRTTWLVVAATTGLGLAMVALRSRVFRPPGPPSGARAVPASSRGRQ